MNGARGHSTTKRQFSAFTMNIVFVILSLTGLALIPRLTVKLNPGYTTNSLSVSFLWPYALPGMLEHEVTSKLEGAFSTLRGIEHVISESSAGYGYIILEAKKGANLQTLRFEVLSIIKDFWQHLPEGVSYPEINSGNAIDKKQNLLFSYVLKGARSTSELQQYAENILQPGLAAARDISNVEVFGASSYEWQFHYNDEQLKYTGYNPRIFIVP